MKTKGIELKNDGQETKRFVDLAQKIVAVPKKEIDRRIAEERQAKEQNKDRKRKA